MAIALDTGMKCVIGHVVEVSEEYGMSEFTLDNGYSFTGSLNKYKVGDILKIEKWISGTVNVTVLGRIEA